MQITPNGIAYLEDDTGHSLFVTEKGTLDYDVYVMPYISKYVKESDIVIDAGAFIGGYTEHFRKLVGIDGLVIAVEPNLETFKCLEHNMLEHGNVYCHHAALSDRVGRVSLIDSKNKTQVYSVQGDDVECTTIDAFGISRCNFIKIDVEGFEPEVLMGARQTIQRCRPLMVIEINDRTLLRRSLTRKVIFDLLDIYDYRYENIHPEQDLQGSKIDIICFPN